MTAMTDLFREQLKAYNNAVEEACEKALQGGICGVRVVTKQGSLEEIPNGLQILDRYLIEVHPSVPYGTIHYYPQGLPDD